MPFFLLNRSALAIGLAAAFLVACGGSHVPSVPLSNGAAPVAFKHQMVFDYTGRKQTFTVPADVRHIRIIAVGANGGGTPYARGGRVSAVVPVTPSERLAVYVGGSGKPSGSGFNGGAPGGFSTGTGGSGNGGGGASDVREGGDALKDRIVVAGGGGGTGTYNVKRHGLGGAGGPRIGAPGRHGYDNLTPNRRKAGQGGAGGTGGTQASGGTGGTTTQRNPRKSGANGRLGVGGAGGSGCNPTSSSSGCGPPAGGGGGGGGGFYGGGGGAGGFFSGCCGSGGGGGGGGGSSYVESTGTDVLMWQDWPKDQGGTVTIYW